MNFINKIIINRHSSLAIEFMSGICAVLWGFWLLAPLDTFGISASYIRFAQFAPEWAWGAAMLFTGILQIYFLFSGTFRQRERSMKFACITWMTIAVFFGLANFGSTGVPIYGAFAGMSLWASLKLVAINNLK